MSVLACTQYSWVVFVPDLSIHVCAHISLLLGKCIERIPGNINIVAPAEDQPTQGTTHIFRKVHIHEFDIKCKILAKAKPYTNLTKLRLQSTFHREVLFNLQASHGNTEQPQPTCLNM